MHFHARYSARRKTYAYIVHHHSVPSALQAPYAWHVPQALALPAMRAAARVLLGRHDFSAFRAASARRATHGAVSSACGSFDTPNASSLCSTRMVFYSTWPVRLSARSWPLAGRSSPLTRWPPFCNLASGGTLALQPQRTACSWCALSMTPRRQEEHSPCDEPCVVTQRQGFYVAPPPVLLAPEILPLKRGGRDFLN
jgi:hypothetical protein